MSAEQQGRVFRKELEENRGKKRKEKLHITDSPIKPNPLSAAKRPHSLTGAPVSLPHNNRGIKTKQQTQHTLALLDPVRPVFIYGKMRRLQTLVPIPPSPSLGRPAPSAVPPSIKPGAEGRRRHPAVAVAWDRGCASCQTHLHTSLRPTPTALFRMLSSLFYSSASLCHMCPFFVFFSRA